MAERRNPYSGASGRGNGEVSSAGTLEDLARRYGKALTRFFQRRVPAIGTEADDLAQEVFVRLAQRSKGDTIRSDEGYLFQTASSVLVDRARRRAVRHGNDHVEYEDDLHAVEDFAPDRVLLGREQVAIVRAVLAELPDNVRAAFILHRFEELTYNEIARRLGVSVSAVEKYIMRALKEITARTMGEP